MNCKFCKLHMSPDSFISWKALAYLCPSLASSLTCTTLMHIHTTPPMDDPRLMLVRNAGFSLLRMRFGLACLCHTPASSPQPSSFKGSSPLAQTCRGLPQEATTLFFGTTNCSCTRYKSHCPHQLSMSESDRVCCG